MSHPNQESWCDWEGNPTSWAGPLPSIEMVSEGQVWASPSLLRFRNPESFTAGNLSNCSSTWERIINPSKSKLERDILSFIKVGVKAQEFFTHFKGTFQGNSYDSDRPPKASFPNSKSCENFTDFINETILERVKNGSLNVWGKVSDVSPPHLVMPITIEPSKPRLCHDERFLNNWIKQCPFSLDYITDLPRYVRPNHLQTTIDDKSGYDHVRLHPSCHTYFGLQWNGWYFVYTTLPFGWKASAFIYNSIGMVATSYFRSLGVPCTQYIDDRHIGQLRIATNAGSCFSSIQLAEMAAFITCSGLITLGYFIGLKKSLLSPQSAVRFLGYICDSQKQAFILPEDKRLKFSTLREAILSHKSVSLKNLQKFAGKSTSFALLVPAAKLFSNCTYQAISYAQRSSSRQIRITDSLRNELTHWRFLDSWTGFLPWKDEKHMCLSVHSDASNTGWGGILECPGQSPKKIRGYWDDEIRHQPIAVKEAQALLNTLQPLLSSTFNMRIDAFIDNKVVLHSWDRQVSKSHRITSIMKELFSLCLAHNLSLSTHFVPSKQNNIADGLSRTVSDLDACLSPSAWLKVNSTFGPHTVDLMALPENVRRDAAGRPLRFFSPLPCAGSAGINVFAQEISQEENAYVFPPFTLIGPLLKHLESQDCPLTIVVPDLWPRKYWWPILCRSSSSSIKLGSKGDTNVLFFPSRSSNASWVPRPLQWELWAFRISSCEN